MKSILIIQWGVENSLHWKLDIGFREDECRKRKGNSSENFAIMRQIALNLLNQEKTIMKAGVNAKRLRAGWDNSTSLLLKNGRLPYYSKKHKYQLVE